MDDPHAMDSATSNLLAEIQRDLQEHMSREESALERIERLLDGNGQPGLVRSHTSHDERIKNLERWKAWFVGFMVTTSLAAIALLSQIALHFIKVP